MIHRKIIDIKNFTGLPGRVTGLKVDEVIFDATAVSLVVLWDSNTSDIGSAIDSFLVSVTHHDTVITKSCVGIKSLFFFFVFLLL